MIINDFYLKLLHHTLPSLPWKQYAKLCKPLLKKSLFILSFDCDTEEDADVVLSVHTRLSAMGIIPTYAVPGELLMKYTSAYRAIQKLGAEFINHGGKTHTVFDDNKKSYVSTFFYDQEPLATVKEDILLGHQLLKDTLGITAQGFRTPHFGTFQDPKHLHFLYTILKELNYTFSSSTTPSKSYQYGPCYQQGVLWEIPVTGIFSKPLNVMDSWGYFAAPDRTQHPNDFLADCQSLACFAEQHPILINIYADPSHIHDQDLFFDGMAYLRKVSENSSYYLLCEKIKT